MTLALTCLFMVVLDPNIRSNMRSMIRPHYRVILAIAQADLDNSGQKFQILKIKTDEGLYLEVYGQKNGFQQLVSSVKLPDKKDGYFTFNGQVTNLAIDDVNGDNRREILATSFDNDLVAHLNVYRYIPGRNVLELVTLN